MDQFDDLDKILGTGLTEEELLKKITPVEIRLLEKVVHDFLLDVNDQRETIRALYRFKETSRNHIRLWKESADLRLSQVREAEKIFTQMEIHLDDNSRSCFSKENFFGRVRFMLLPCRELHVRPVCQKTYLKWLFSFPITLENSIGKLMENELYPNNLPHNYMYQLAGFVRRRLIDKYSPTQIAAQYKTFLKEMNISQAHNKWFQTRLHGSYGSRK